MSSSVLPLESALGRPRSGISRLVGSLSMILGAFASCLAAWRWFSRGPRAVDGGDPIEELGSIALSRDFSARLVRCAGSIVVFAETSQGLVKLKEINDPRVVDQLVRRFGQRLEA